MECFKSISQTWKRKKPTTTDTVRRASPFNGVYYLVVSGRLRNPLFKFIGLTKDWRLGWRLIFPHTDPGYRQLCPIGNEEVILEFLHLRSEYLWSTKAIYMQYLRDADGFAFVFCIRCRESFDKLVEDAESILQLHKEERKRPIIVLGSEPGYCEEDATSMRQVTKEEAENFAERLGARYFELCPEPEYAKCDRAPFQDLVKKIRSAEPVA
ncbi:hypothetical protein AJ80_05432 [Polytolypa hystricis UAMH7299]|uniref:small monomeric GTPase n=1 Tax=Polytolypa hystricis (strain UAMH7299) TaxID=1447883 RepID=A0A2B7XVD1_POLH7|nr:hypothetical protein AJ80_05432 [Polytolypa hystricis UAMH7299]